MKLLILVHYRITISSCNKDPIKIRGKKGSSSRTYSLRARSQLDIENANQTHIIEFLFGLLGVEIRRSFL